LLAPIPRTRTDLTTRRHWRNRLHLRRPASGRSHYNYFRDYDPALGRYAKSDPIGLAGGINTYSYVRSRPLKRVDPRGLCDQCDMSQAQARANSEEEVARRMIARYITASIVNGVEYCGFICQTPDLKSFFSMPAATGPIEGFEGSSCQPALIPKCPECSIQRALWHTHPGGPGAETLSGTTGDTGAALNHDTGRMGPYGTVDAKTASGISVYGGTPSRQVWVYQGRVPSGPHRLQPIGPGEGLRRTNF
jgi:RHS repeat-associated protein